MKMQAPPLPPSHPPPQLTATYREAVRAILSDLISLVEIRTKHTPAPISFIRSRITEWEQEIYDSSASPEAYRVKIREKYQNCRMRLLSLNRNMNIERSISPDAVDYLAIPLEECRAATRILALTMPRPNRPKQKFMAIFNTLASKLRLVGMQLIISKETLIAVNKESLPDIQQLRDEIRPVITSFLDRISPPQFDELLQIISTRIMVQSQMRAIPREVTELAKELELKLHPVNGT